MFGIGSSPHQYEGDYELGNDYSSGYDYAGYYEPEAWYESTVQGECPGTFGFVDFPPFEYVDESNFDADAESLTCWENDTGDAFDSRLQSYLEELEGK